MQASSSQLDLSNGVSTGAFTSAPTSQPSEGSADPSTQPVPLLAEYAATWLDSIRGLVRPRTYEGYTYRLERHILPRLGQLRLDEIGVDDVLALIGELRESGYSGWSIRSILTPLSRLFSHAVRRDLIAASPISKLDRSERPAVWNREQRVLNSQEIGRLLDAAPPRYRTLIATAILTGLRQSELLGLRWRDIDFEDELIRVRSALDRHGNDVPPKTQHAVRDVILIPALAAALREHREASPFKSSKDYVFASRIGTPLHWRNVARRALKPALAKAGIEPLRWHDLRHTFASLLIGGGANVVFTSRQLGHGSSDITLRVYSHLFDRAEQAQRTRDLLETTLGDVIRTGQAATPAEDV
ncbi:MAG: tyrosine-type recombinase/integrase [Gaiellaceae bacterium]